VLEVVAEARDFLAEVTNISGAGANDLLEDGDSFGEADLDGREVGL
jgi:hypothetical protein